MARITIEDCLKAGYDKFGLVHLTVKRVFQLRKGKEPLISSSNREVVVALREIAAGKVKPREADNLLEEKLPEEDLAGDNLEEESESPDKEDNMDIDKGENLLDET